MAYDERQLDLVLATLLTGLALNERVLARLVAAGHGDVRFSHGFVFQHLIDGPLPVGALARRLGVSQQAASKAAAELERLGYLERVACPEDGRAKIIRLTPRGRDAALTGRRIFSEIEAEWAEQIGEDLVRSLREAAERIAELEDSPAPGPHAAA